MLNALTSPTLQEITDILYLEEVQSFPGKLVFCQFYFFKTKEI